MVKGQPEKAREALERGVEVCLRGGNLRYASEARLFWPIRFWQLGDVERARGLIETVRNYLRETPSLLAWGLMMRMFAKLEAAEGHIAAAIQSLGQSTSIYSLRGNAYDCAINRVLRARLLEKQGRMREAASEMEAALEDFTRLGATIDEKNARISLESLKANLDASENVKASEETASPDLPSQASALKRKRARDRQIRVSLPPSMVSSLKGLCKRRFHETCCFTSLPRSYRKNLRAEGLS